MKNLVKIILIAAFITGASLSFGQSKALKKGVKKITKGEYDLAISQFQKYTDSRELVGEANFYLGECYRLSNRVHQAEDYYKKAIERGYRAEEVYFYYAFALKMNRKYKDAQIQLERFLNVAENKELIKHANVELDNLAKIDEILNKKTYYTVASLEDLNTENAEYSPVYQDGFLYFTSNRGVDKIYKATGTGFTDLFRVSTQGANVEIRSLENLGEEINLFNVNEGSVTFTPDGRTMVFARGNSGKRKGSENVDLFITRFRNREWSDARPININDNGAWDSTPAFSANGRILYFASDRKGGYGGVDLYAATIDRTGRFTRVRNLGPEVNTPGNEMFPYVADDGNLYFASDGHPGIGGLDLFVARRVNGQTTIENLGVPMNSSADDFGLYLFKIDRGFFSSSRDGGKGDDDIYTFLNDDPNLKIVNYFLTGVTKSRDQEGNEKILPNVAVKLLRDERLDTQEMDEMVTGNDGKFNFRIYPHENYILVGEKPPTDVRYFTTRLSYTTIGKGVPQEELKELVTNITLDTTLVLDQIVIDKAIVLENIYYNFGSADIRPDAAQELDKLVNILLDNPEIAIELSSHTDSVDTEQYNLRLSSNRAKAAVDYIIRQGISKDRIIAKGYGESRPIAANTNPDGSDNEEGRQKNRRTEFKVIRIDQIQSRQEELFDEDRFFQEEGSGAKKQGQGN
jgi:outer membrane protein OmpA-like peptidoglycan-associated protein/tetratricopeptide (TPR) repeat protein